MATSPTLPYASLTSLSHIHPHPELDLSRPIVVTHCLIISAQTPLTVRPRISCHQRPTMAEQTLNIPQIFVFLVVSALVIRWLFSKPSTSGAQSAHSGRGDSRISPAQIDQIASMFPQLDRRMIAWDLQRNGGNVAATTERVLSGRSLETVCNPIHY